MSSSDDTPKKGVKLKINKEYADNMNYVRRVEESQRLKDRYGRELSSSDSDQSTDDEDGLLDSKQKNLDFLTVLGKIKSKNPEIYDGKSKFYHSSSSSSDASEPEEEAPQKMNLKQYHEKLVEQGGLDSDMEDQPESKTYVEEQKKLIQAFKSDSDDDGNLDDLVKKKNKTKKEKKKEEVDFKKWLLEKDSSKQKSAEFSILKPLKKAWQDEKIDKNEAFLKDYILNEKWLKKESDSDDSDNDSSDDDILNIWLQKYIFSQFQ